jgi:hypothetical protein
MVGTIRRRHMTKTAIPVAKQLVALHPDVMGRRIPNLVVVQDSQDPKAVEFRVQLEVPIPETDIATKLQDNLRNKTPSSLRESQELVIGKIDTLATPTFQLLVRYAFEDNIRDAGVSTRGRKIPNLVVVQDAETGKEKEVEFRVQLEVYIPDPTASESLQKDIREKTASSLKDAQDLITPFIDPMASPVFRRIVGLAFDDNIRELTQ